METDSWRLIDGSPSVITRIRLIGDGSAPDCYQIAHTLDEIKPKWQLNGVGSAQCIGCVSIASFDDVESMQFGWSFEPLHNFEFSSSMDGFTSIKTSIYY